MCVARPPNENHKSVDESGCSLASDDGDCGGDARGVGGGGGRVVGGGGWVVEVAVGHVRTVKGNVVPSGSLMAGASLDVHAGESVLDTVVVRPAAPPTLNTTYGSLSVPLASCDGSSPEADTPVMSSHFRGAATAGEAAAMASDPVGLVAVAVAEGVGLAGLADGEAVPPPF
jgi:hypothetical protein